jgi:hypothetical protein
LKSLRASSTAAALLYLVYSVLCKISSQRENITYTHRSPPIHSALKNLEFKKGKTHRLIQARKGRLAIECDAKKQSDRGLDFASSQFFFCTHPSSISLLSFAISPLVTIHSPPSPLVHCFYNLPPVLLPAHLLAYRQGYIDAL